MKKRMVSVLLTCVMVLGMTACGANDTSATSKEENQETEAAEADGEQESETKEEAAEEPAQEEATEQVEVTVFAAASMTETLTEISELYKKECPNVNLTFNFDSSGTLKTQIQEGAACDLFISAGQKQMDQMDSSADPEVNTEGLDLVQEDTKIGRASCRERV